MTALPDAREYLAAKDRIYSAHETLRIVAGLVAEIEKRDADVIALIEAAKALDARGELWLGGMAPLQLVTSLRNALQPFTRG